MAKTKPAPTPDPPAGDPSPLWGWLAWIGLGRKSGDKSKGRKGNDEGTRETIESIAVAFLAAFMFRTFLAEAFVIPTGSMAPTLFGRHKDVDCPECGTHFHVGASDEVRPPDALEEFVGQQALYYAPQRLTRAFCPNCRLGIDIENRPVFSGDRILVNKWPFEFSDPDRWDVVVFKYPEGPQTNYIKRLVGLPGEEIQVERGDVYARGDDGVRQILRKRPGKQRDLQIPVYDDTRPPVALLEKGWPERWQGVRPDDEEKSGWSRDESSWQLDSGKRTYSLAAGNEPRWLRYWHIVPGPDWNKLPKGGNAAPRLVTDFLAYNTYTGGIPRGEAGGALVDGDRWAGYWVGDLTIEGRFAFEKAEGELLLELVEGYRHYRCRIDLATGRATLSQLEFDRDEPVEFEIASADTRLRSPGTYRIAFANVDQRLDLWVDGSHIPFEKETTYAPTSLPGPAPADLAPVGIAVTGTPAVVDQLRLYRDVYYRAEENVTGRRGDMRPEVSDSDLDRLALVDDDPEAWSAIYEERNRVVKFDKLADDEFFMLGDNSARSQDSRLWTNGWDYPALKRERRHVVPRSAIVGKAFFVYWPHGIPFLNDGKGYSGWARPIPFVNRLFWHREITADGSGVRTGLSPDYPLRGVPFYPQFWRMQRIR